VTLLEVESIRTREAPSDKKPAAQKTTENKRGIREGTRNVENRETVSENKDFMQTATEYFNSFWQ